jgi:hypothetical protein
MWCGPWHYTGHVDLPCGVVTDITLATLTCRVVPEFWPLLDKLKFIHCELQQCKKIITVDCALTSYDTWHTTCVNNRDKPHPELLCIYPYRSATVPMKNLTDYASNSKEIFCVQIIQMTQWYHYLITDPLHSQLAVRSLRKKTNKHYNAPFSVAEPSQWNFEVAHLGKIFTVCHLKFHPQSTATSLRVNEFALVCVSVCLLNQLYTLTYAWK